MKKMLHFQVIGGISGDMTVAGLLDLGVPFSILEEGLHQLEGLAVQISSKKSQKHQITGTQFLVETTESQPQRSYRHIKQLIEASNLRPSVQERALKIFAQLAIAEGTIHNKLPEDVHFHEVGAWDSIADIVSVALCLDYLQIDDIYVSPIPTGTGFVQTAHGMMPIPAPATLELLKGFEIIQDSLPFERITPTGAAILAALAQPQPEAFQYTVERVGIGSGNQERSEVPNILRCILGCKNDSQDSQNAHHLEWLECSETNIDDSTPECLGYVHAQLFAAGALDVWFIPIQLKKNRPGLLLQVLHPPELRIAIHRLIFRETTSLGIRYQTLQRLSLKREMVQIATPWGMIRGKRSFLGEQIQFSPEFEDCRIIASQHEIPLKQVFRIVEENFWKQQNQKNPTEGV